MNSYCPSLLGGPPEQAGFQLFTSVPGISLARIPDNLPFENAAVLPLSLSTAAAALYQKGQLALPYPTIPAKPLGKTLLVWGGSSSVGSSAIQLAVASGLNVTSTASPKNYDYVKSLGATYVFDYNDSSVIEDLVKTFKGTEFVGAFDAISTTKTIKQSHEVVSRMGGGKLSTTLSSTAVIPGDVSISNGENCSPLITCRGVNIATNRISVFAKSIIVDEDDVGRAIYTQFVYPALQKQILRAKPDPYIIHGGLEQIQDAISIQKAGVSAQKIVVSLTS